MKNVNTTVFVMGADSNGEQALLAFDMTVTEDQYDNGDHYDIAKMKACDTGYEVRGCFDQNDTAGQQLLGKKPMYGDSKHCLGHDSGELDTTEGPERDFTMEVCRVGYGVREFTVRATSMSKAHERALAEAGGMLFSEHTSEYEVIGSMECAEVKSVAA